MLTALGAERTESYYKFSQFGIPSPKKTIYQCSVILPPETELVSISLYT
jgi:hypothetical protein